jgi:hypothetical protein
VIVKYWSFAKAVEVPPVLLPPRVNDLAVSDEFVSASDND